MKLPTLSFKGNKEQLLDYLDLVEAEQMRLEKVELANLKNDEIYGR